MAGIANSIGSSGGGGIIGPPQLISTPSFDERIPQEAAALEQYRAGLQADSYKQDSGPTLNADSFRPEASPDKTTQEEQPAQEDSSPQASPEAPASGVQDADASHAIINSEATIEASKLQPPTQEFGVLGNIGAGLGLLGAITGIPEAQQLGQGLLGILDRQQQNDRANFKREQEQVYRKSFASSSQKQFGFDNATRSTMEQLPSSMQEQLNKVRLSLKDRADKNAKSIAKEKEKSDSITRLSPLLEGLDQNNKILAKQAIIDGNHSRLGEILKNATNVKPISLTGFLNSPDASKVDFSDDSSIRAHVERQYSIAGKIAKAEEIDSWVDTLKKNIDVPIEQPTSILGKTIDKAKQTATSIGEFFGISKPVPRNMDGDYYSGVDSTGKVVKIPKKFGAVGDKIIEKAEAAGIRVNKNSAFK